MVELRPVRTEADYERAMEEVERLWGAPNGSAEADQLEVLATLIDDYESIHFPIDPPDPIDAILFRMEQQGLSRKDLEPIIGSRARIAEVLSRKRGLSLAMIRRLHATLGIPADVLIRPTRRHGKAVVERSRQPVKDNRGRSALARCSVDAHIESASRSGQRPDQTDS